MRRHTPDKQKQDMKHNIMFKEWKPINSKLMISKWTKEKLMGSNVFCPGFYKNLRLPIPFTTKKCQNKNSPKFLHLIWDWDCKGQEKARI